MILWQFNMGDLKWFIGKHGTFILLFVIRLFILFSSFIALMLYDSANESQFF